MLEERLALSSARVREIITETELAEPFGEYFRKLAQFIVFSEEIRQSREGGSLFTLPEEELRKINRKSYEDVLPDDEQERHYSASYANPNYAVEKLGKEYGPLLSWLWMEVRGLILLGARGEKEDIAQILELFLQIYFAFRAGEELPSPESIRKDIYWYVSDYADYTVPQRIRRQLDPTLTFYKDIIMKSDLADSRYLYAYGDYISDDERGIAHYLGGKDQEFIDSMARTLVQGFVRGFEVYRVDLSKKKNVQIHAYIGFERVLRSMLCQFKELGLDCVISGEAVRSIDKKSTMRGGLHSLSVNPQMEYDHRLDRGLYLDGNFCERVTEETRRAYETYRHLAADLAGPVLLDIFGEKPFEPAQCPARVTLGKKQQALDVKMAGQLSRIANEYIPADETSFSIISWPIPSIGKDFEAIMDETVVVNNLDNDLYREVQQRMIDALNGAEYVRVTGRDGNTTNMQVSLWQLQDPEKEAVFENCCADVNIPVGEVFTSPVLEGTTGILNVSGVYLDGIFYRNLKLRFEDGFVRDYSCDNFEDPAEGKVFIEQNLLEGRETLPLGEFAIGTNTTAFTMTRKYGIAALMPILIMEKTGPHFAIGDTCYSHMEDHKVYNPDGKEIVARENSCSRLRGSDPEKAYFNVHTDITIPYGEIGAITAVFADGRETDIMRDGRFVLPGTEPLNDALQ